MKGRLMVLLAAVGVALAGIAAIAQAPPAQAHDHLIPKTVLKKGATKLQVGLKVIDSSWSQPAAGNECVNQTASYTSRFPDTDRVAAGSKLRVRVFKRQQPNFFMVTAYRALNADGIPSGNAQRLTTSLRRVVRDGRTVAWDAIFYVERPDRHYYLITERDWQDRQGCGGDQWAHWSFHVRT